MSINGISSTSGAGRIAAAAPTADVAAAASATLRAAEAANAPPGEVKQEEAEDTRTSVHFPWLSRLSAELEAASRQRARFPTQIMGDHLDKKA